MLNFNIYSDMKKRELVGKSVRVVVSTLHNDGKGNVVSNFGKVTKVTPIGEGFTKVHFLTNGGGSEQSLDLRDCDLFESYSKYCAYSAYIKFDTFEVVTTIIIDFE